MLLDLIADVRIQLEHDSGEVWMLARADIYDAGRPARQCDRRQQQDDTEEEHTHAKIAGMLGISEGTSKSQLSYARSILRKRLRHWHPEDFS